MKTSVDETAPANPFGDKLIAVVVAQGDFDDLEPAHAPFFDRDDGSDGVLLTAALPEFARGRRKAQILVSKREIIEQSLGRVHAQFRKQRRGFCADAGELRDWRHTVLLFALNDCNAA